MGTVRDDGRIVGWFYRMLRNDLADHYRRRSVEADALQRHGGSEPVAADHEGGALDRSPCRCVLELLATLPAQYATILKRVDLDGATVNDVASEQGLSANNVRVRLHRARRALRQRVERHCGACADERCHDCICGSEPH